MSPTPKIHNIFSPTNTPRDPDGRRDPEFSSIRTSVSVFMDALSKARMVRKIQRMACLLEAFGVLVGKKIQLNDRPNGSCRLRGPDVCRCAREGRHMYAPRTRSPTRGWSVELMSRCLCIETMKDLLLIFFCSWDTSRFLMACWWAQTAAVNVPVEPGRAWWSRSWWTLHHPNRGSVSSRFGRPPDLGGRFHPDLEGRPNRDETDPRFG